MTLNPHTRLASFYRYFYLTGNLPNNLCNYFWGLVLAFMLTPFVLPALIINRLTNSIKLHTFRDNKYYDTSGKPIPTFLGVVFNSVIFIFAIIPVTILDSIGIDIKTTINSSGVILGISEIILIGYVSITICILFFKLIIFMWRFLTPKYTPEQLQVREQKRNEKEAANRLKLINKNKRESGPNLLKLAWKSIVAVKEKNCPLITWDYKKNEK